MQGWIKLHRRIQEHWLYQEKRKFSRFEAWIDLLMMVNHEDAKIVLGNEIVEVKRGQRITSIRQLCDRWGWSNTKVTQFLKLLQNDGMLTVKSDSKKTLITIANYNFYQGDDHKKTTENRHENDMKQTEKHTNKNEKNDKNEKNVVVDEVPPANYEQVIIQKYMQLAAIPSFDIPEIDKFAIRQVFNEGVPLDDALNLLEQCFRDFKPKHARDKINSFRYCATYILNKYFQKKEGVNNVYPIYRRSNGQTTGEIQSKPAPIFGDFVGRLPRKSTPL